MKIRRGLTLLELIITISILSMLLALGVAILQSSTKNFQASSAKSKIISLMKGAMQESAILRQYSWAVFDKGGKQFWIITSEDAGTETFDAATNANDMKAVQKVPGLKGSAGKFSNGSSVTFKKLKRYNEQTGVSMGFWFQALSPCSRIVTIENGPYMKCNGDNTLSVIWGSETLTSRSPLSPGRWHYIYVVILPFEMRLYMNSYYEDAVTIDKKLPEKFDVYFGKPATDKSGISSALFDEIRVHLLVNSQTLLIPEETAVEFDADQIKRNVVAFNKSGQFILSLSPQGKIEWDCPGPEPIQVTIKSQVETLKLVINPNGTLE